MCCLCSGTRTGQQRATLIQKNNAITNVSGGTRCEWAQWWLIFEIILEVSGVIGSAGMEIGVKIVKSEKKII